MQFNEFAQKLSQVIRAGANTCTFTKTILEAIIIEDGHNILDSKKESSYKNYFNGNTKISGISKKIAIYVDPKEFIKYLKIFPKNTNKQLYNIFKDDIDDINPSNTYEKIAELFANIIIEASGTKKNTVKGNKKCDTYTPLKLSPNGIPKRLPITQTFQKYLNDASVYYSTKKTLLFAEKPCPFYDLYVCNDIRRNKLFESVEFISGVTVEKLEQEAKYIIIQGLGGIGKSMLMTHLFLSSAKQVETTGSIPLLLSLKDYKDSDSSIVDFILKSVNEYDLSISKEDIIDSLEQKRLILLLDGLDEIQSSIRDTFNQHLESLLKAYSGNTIIITSRPVHMFISYSKFTIFDIQDLTKEQALELIGKLDFWDKEGKASFMIALDRNLYSTHKEFASNPLLLTIMLMTYSSFGEVPAKMHVFYSKAYETMARLHDASKGSFKRPLHTKLTPEEFAKYFAQFCARTYMDEVLEFDSLHFTEYMKKVLKTADPEHRNILPRAFLLDLTENLCIMYSEGERYYFIHRSFQEYFTAVYFASEYDTNLVKVGNYFENLRNRSYTDRTFDMLYDMIPQKIERFIFLPFLEKLISGFEKEGEGEREYWEFLKTIYPVLYFEEGDVGVSYLNIASSFLYRFIIYDKNLDVVSELDYCEWPSEIYELPTRNWVNAYSNFLVDEAYDRFPDYDSIPHSLLLSTELVEEDELPSLYSDYFGDPKVEGMTIDIEISELIEEPEQYITLKNYMEQDDFPLCREYKNIKNYYHNLKKRTKLETSSEDLFDN